MSAHSDVSSNAFNFPGFVKSSVDPRTGQYTVNIELPELKGNALAGPDLPLALAFNPLNLIDSGFGLGWDLRLSQYVPDTGMLSLFSGDSFKVTGSDIEPDIPERKIYNFRFFDDGNGIYRLVHKSGLVEILKTSGSQGKRVALPASIHSPLGHRLTLEYDTFNGYQCLSRVSDQGGDLLRILRDDFSVKIRLPPFSDDDEGNSFVLQLTGRRVMKVVLPTPELASWRFSYGQFFGKSCITEVHTPLGGRETLEYGDQGHPFPGKSGRSNLPRVTRHRLYPEFNQPMMEIDYSYSEENFLGYNSGISWDDNGTDQLYKVHPGYVYTSTAAYRVDEKIVRTVHRIYDRFHLQTLEEIQQNDNVKQIATRYFTEDRPFEQQPRRFQLPSSTETRWRHAKNPTLARNDIAHTEFDDYGNLISETREDGVRLTHLYYKAEGEDGCPADPDGFVRNIKETRIAPPQNARDGEPELVTRFRYKALAPLAGAPNNPMLLKCREDTVAVRGEEEELLNHSEIFYFEDPADDLLHGRRQRLDFTVKDATGVTTFTYSRERNERLAEDVLRTVETFTAFDDSSRTLTRHQSLVHGELLLDDDENAVEVLCRYDRFRRLVEEVVAPGSDVQVSRHHDHVLVASHGQQATQTTTDVRGVQTRIRVDGLGRPVAMEHAHAGGWLQIYSARYDALGQLIAETRSDWLDGEEMPLTTGYEYDDWGRVWRTTRPDGVIEVSEISPFGDGGDLQRTWLESGGQARLTSQLTVTQFNAFDKPDWIERLDEQEQCIARQAFFYDGYAHCTRHEQVLQETTLTTLYEYDVHGRVERTHLPDRTVIERDFDRHSTGELSTAMRVIPANALEPTVCVGEQQFDGLERLAWRSVGPRRESYDYEGGKSLVRQRTTPAGECVDYHYKVNLSEQPDQISVPGNTATYGFDPRDASLTLASNAQGNREYYYNAAGHLEREVWLDSSGQSHETTYETSLFGLPLRVEHDQALTTYLYDGSGRVRQMTQGQLQADFDFDLLGRPRCTTTRDLDSGDTLVSKNEYDSLGRVELRSLCLNDQPPRTIRHVWREDDQLCERHQEMAGRSLLLETFTYDLRGRLGRYTCSGERLPSDRYGNEISSQLFLFDALDNIKRCVTAFASGKQDVAVFTYADEDPCQLRNVRHSLTEAGYPGSQDFSYDADGNLLNDELGQHLRYDNLGRLLEVTSADGQRSMGGYRYDGHQHLLASREGDAPETLRFYEGYDLSFTVQDNTRTLCFSHEGVPLGQQQLDDHERTLLLLTDASPSVIGESIKAGLRETVYGVYGELQDERRLQSLLAFNGEPRESTSGWYLLGRGYRAYNPGLMRFHSPDSQAPFEDGGVNPYVYCLGNPVRFHDPSGHRSDRRPGTDPIYIDPIEQPTQKKGWIDWLPVAVMALFTIPLVIAVPWTAPALTVGFIMAAGGAGVAVAGLGLAVWGTLEDNPTLVAIGGAMVAVGTILITQGRSMLKAAKIAERARLGAQGAFQTMNKPLFNLPGNLGKRVENALSWLARGGRSRPVTQSAGNIRGGGTTPAVAAAPPPGPPGGAASTAMPAPAPPPVQVPTPVQAAAGSRNVRLTGVGRDKLWIETKGSKVPKFSFYPIKLYGA
ncbi:RHS repeat domain-containing protein [Pseudomonas japonica]|uniref:RHS repeat domain-containing protein n=1 Tax=Pseudomonas japonica TaxID=256466 RepID=UPI003818CCFB